MENRQPGNGYEVDVERLRAAVQEVNANWDVERDGPIFRFEPGDQRVQFEAQAADLQPPGAASSQPDPFAEWYARQLEQRQVLLNQDRQERYDRMFDLSVHRNSTGGLPPVAPMPYPGGYLVAPPPVYRPGEFTAFHMAQERLDRLDQRIATQKRLIYAQVVLLVIWIVLQVISTLQRMGRFG